MSSVASLLALIPARSGSKRIPGKNIRPFFGHPMLAYTVAAALNTGLFRRVVVSTDDPLTGRVAEWYGAEYLPRPQELATDEATLVEVGIQALEALRLQGTDFDMLCQLMPNCPLRTGRDILDHYSLFRRERRCFQISVVPYLGVYPHWALGTDEEERGHWLFGSEYVIRSQELEKAYCPTGAIWWVRVADFLSQKAFYGSPFHLAPMDATRGLDIDSPEDMEFAEILVEGVSKRDMIFPLEPIASEAFPLEGLHVH